MLASKKLSNKMLGALMVGAFACGCIVVAVLYHAQSSNVQVTYDVIDVAGFERSYRLALPAEWAVSKSQQAIPLIIALHGAIDTVDQMAAGTQLDQLPNDHLVAICYLQGRNLNWPPFIPENNPTHADPDYAFFDAAIADISTKHSIDQSRVYLVGVSQGGAMTNLIVANRSPAIAAAVDCCGWLPEGIGDVANTPHKCPVLFVVGTDDQQVPPSNVQKARKAFQSAGHPTEYVEIAGFGHGWPDEHGMNEIVWAFLSRHRLQSGTME